jgi:MFS family permease
MLSGRIAASIGSKAAVIIGAVFSAGAYFILAFAHSSSWEIYTASAMIGVGLGLAFSAMSNLIVQAVPPAQTGVASGMNANIRTIGGALGAAVMSTIVTSGLQADGYPKSTSYAVGFAFLGGVTVFAVIASLLIPTAVAEEADHDHAHHLLNAELALVAGGTIAEE